LRFGAQTSPPSDSSARTAVSRLSSDAPKFGVAPVRGVHVSAERMQHPNHALVAEERREEGRSLSVPARRIHIGAEQVQDADHRLVIRLTAR
jgi:hypothetical protein